MSRRNACPQPMTSVRSYCDAACTSSVERRLGPIAKGYTVDGVDNVQKVVPSQCDCLSPPDRFLAHPVEDSGKWGASPHFQMLWRPWR